MDLLKRFSIEDYAPKPTPMEDRIRFNIDVAGALLLEDGKERY